jgi:hypothetical protein
MGECGVVKHGLARPPLPVRHNYPWIATVIEKPGLKGWDACIQPPLPVRVHTIYLQRILQGVRRTIPELIKSAGQGVIHLEGARVAVPVLPVQPQHASQPYRRFQCSVHKPTLSDSSLTPELPL